jgi:STE24 endopeptidase
MEYNVFYFAIIAVLFFGYFSDLALEFLNSSRRSHPIPKQLDDVYETDSYNKQQEYEKSKSKFGLISGGVSFLATICMFIFGIFGILDSWISAFASLPIVSALYFFGIIALASSVLSLPFDIYATFVIEEKFGFNRTTVKTYVLDKLKGLALAAVIGGAILSLIIWFIDSFPDTFWIYAWICLSAITVFMAMFYSTLIVPIFNKQKPLEDGSLRDAITAYGEKAGFSLDSIFVIDGSKRSSKANAYFSGLGPKKRIVLYDTLINDLTEDEIVAVLAHEVGHYKKKHTYQMMAVSILQTGLMFYLLSLLVSNAGLSAALGSSTHKIHLALIAFGVVYGPVSEIIGLAMNVLSRKNEFEADNFAKGSSSGAALVGALKKLARNNLSNLTPHPAYVFFNYSHPPMAERVNNLML